MYSSVGRIRDFCRVGLDLIHIHVSAGSPFHVMFLFVLHYSVVEDTVALFFQGTFI